MCNLSFCFKFVTVGATHNTLKHCNLYKRDWYNLFQSVNISGDHQIHISILPYTIFSGLLSNKLQLRKWLYIFLTWITTQFCTLPIAQLNLILWSTTSLHKLPKFVSNNTNLFISISTFERRGDWSCTSYQESQYHMLMPHIAI